MDQIGQSSVQSEYTAFISYRHAERDMKLARRIQRSLERFRIPREIREQTGRDRIGRIFRDQDELTAGNLTEEIPEALDRADFLIVICSPASRESAWVQNEVEYFLKTRPLEQVIIVLAEGEPDDVLPLAVLEKQHQRPMEEEWESRSFEHVGCDFRGNQRKAFQTELPRIAATLLGCRYDDLIQRRKQYEMKRRAALLGAGLAGMSLLTAYVLYNNSRIRSQNETILAANEEISRANQEIIRSNEEIQKKNEEITRNYREIQLAQSRTLVQQSAERLSDNDKVSAVSAALSALPGPEDEDKVFLPEAEYALQSALGAYHLPTGGLPAAAGRFRTDFAIRRVAARRGDHCHYIGVVSSNGDAMVWDTLTDQPALEIVSSSVQSFNNNALTHLVLRDETALLIYPDQVICRDLVSGADRWVCPLRPHDYRLREGYAASGTDQVFLWQEETGEDDVKKAVLISVDGDSGKASQVMELPGIPEDCCASEDGAFLALRIRPSDSTGQQLYLCSLKTGESLLLEEGSFTGMRFAGSRFYYLTYIGPDRDPSLETGQYRARMTCYDAETRTRLWACEEPVHAYATAALYCFDDLVAADLYTDLVLYEPESGKRLASVHTPSQIVDVQRESIDEIGTCISILSTDGTRTLYDYDNPEVRAGLKSGYYYSLSLFPDHIDLVEHWRDQMYLLKLRPLSNGTMFYGNEIDIYRPLDADERFIRLAEPDEPAWPLQVLYYESGGQFHQLIEEKNGFLIRSYAADTGTYLSEFRIENQEDTHWTLIGSSGEGELLFQNDGAVLYAGSDTPALCIADPLTGSVREISLQSLDQTAMEMYTGHASAGEGVVKPGRKADIPLRIHSNAGLICGSRIYYLLRIDNDPEHWYWCSFDLKSGAVQTLDVQNWMEALGWSGVRRYFYYNDAFCAFLSPDQSGMLILSEKDSENTSFAEEYIGIIADPESGEYAELSASIRPNGSVLGRSIAWNGNQEVLILEQDGITRVHMDGSMEPVNGLAYRGRPDLIYAQEDLLILQTAQNTEYTLYEYNLPDLTEIGNTAITEGQFRNPRMIPDGSRSILLDAQSSDTVIFHSSAFVLEASSGKPVQMIPNVRAYSAECDSFLQMGGADGNEPGVIRRYTLEDLIEIAEESLKDES